ncbi:hypothetical protein [Nocardia sp. NPDC050175]|uniref:hypothetical protein n=1 Tax=Nocardia sp. NPDC050175 TaxID=3364317 RepID=UPI0037ADBD43
MFGPGSTHLDFPPSDLGQDYLGRGFEPITTIVVALDRSLPTDHVADCAVEMLLAGAPYGQGRRTGPAGMQEHLDSIESHRLGDEVTIQFPVGRARVPS